ncbi:hypothetical protein VTN31DRAFT_5107 [Thermomyces dupontii]|uniref:uncharacterized protein n=1 Tax=Talaromyces thermophilus TaxID=28565 RepID=UPI003741E9A4
MEPPGSPSGPPKFSRYRSVRRPATAAAKDGAAPAPRNVLEETVQPNQPQGDTLTRSKSRYRRPRAATTGHQAAPPHVPSIPQPATPSHMNPSAQSQPKGTIAPQPQYGQVESKSRPQDDDEEELSPEEKARLREEAMRKLTMAERTYSEPCHHVRHQKKAESKGNCNSGNSSEQKRSSWKNKLGLLRAKSERSVNQNDSGAAKFAPGIDAPISAVNAGERRVTVRVGSFTTTLPVTATTRVDDLIQAAAAVLSGKVNPRTAVLLEHFVALGLERPLRRYEHVRDVMNSWASDDANMLILLPHLEGHDASILELHGAPVAQLADSTTFHLYHSSRPGKWDKRYITLRADGQVTVTKKPDSRDPKNFTNICHLSDFDIYTPTPRHKSKVLKPPKQYCYAVKSQQKSTMFLTTENFVHYFATNDAGLAQRWFDAVHGWRSWYHVHALGAGQDCDLAAQGPAKPLIDMAGEPEPGSATVEMFLRKKQDRSRGPPPTSFPASLAPDTKSTPQSQSQLPTPSSRDEDREVDDSDTFSPTGLLGRTYSQRRAAQREREREQDEPFLAHGLLKTLSSTGSTAGSSGGSSQYVLSNSSSRGPSRSNTVRSHAARSRSNSAAAQKPKLLTDPTQDHPLPSSVNLPHRGRGVRVPAGVPLVDAATGPDMSSPLPSSTWRGRPGTAGGGTAPTPTTGLGPGYGSGGPFMPDSLLAQTASAGSVPEPGTGPGAKTGRGVATGDRYATRPLLDLSPSSEFTAGSLLDRIAR